MKYVLNISIVKVFLITVVGCMVNSSVVAGMLEMPDVRDSTPLKGKSVYENIDIPAVKDRDAGLQSGPRVWVLKIKVQGVVERPEYGITKKAIEEYAEKLRSDVMKEEELLKYGYSLDDLGKIADLMIDIDAGKDLEQITEPDVQRLIWLVRELKETRGLTLVNIEDIADKLTRYYRERGFFLTKVYVPKQEVRKGVITLTVLEGKLGKVTVSGNERYNSKLLSGAFDDLLYQPVTEKEIEQKLYLLNDYPGLDTYGYFKAGDQVGDTWLNLQVRAESVWSAVARYDNHGSDLTGKQRLYVEGQLHNQFNLADNLTLGVLKTFNPDNATYGVLRSRIPIVSEEYHLGLNYSRNQFATVVNILEFTGDTEVTELVFDYTHVRRKEKNWTSLISMTRKDSTLTDDNGLLDLSDLVENISLGMRFDSLDSQSKILHQINGTYSFGEIKEGASIGQQEKFKKYTVNYSLLSFLRVPWINASTRIIVKTSFQYSGETLPTVEQFSLAGPNRVRAYDSTQFSADSAIYGGVDWIFTLPAFLDFDIKDNLRLSRVVQPFLFLDYGYGELNGINTSKINRSRLSGYGLGLQFNYNNLLSGNLQFSKPLDSYFSQDFIEEPDDGIRVIADVQYLFN